MKSKASDFGASFGAFFIIALFVLGAVGWVMNIVTIAKADYFTGMIVIRAIGVFIAPLGAVLGWI